MERRRHPQAGREADPPRHDARRSRLSENSSWKLSCAEALCASRQRPHPTPLQSALAGMPLACARTSSKVDISPLESLSTPNACVLRQRHPQTPRLCRGPRNEDGDPSCATKPQNSPPITSEPTTPPIFSASRHGPWRNIAATAVGRSFASSEGASSMRSTTSKPGPINLPAARPLTAISRGAGCRTDAPFR